MYLEQLKCKCDKRTCDQSGSLHRYLCTNSNHPKDHVLPILKEIYVQLLYVYCLLRGYLPYTGLEVVFHHVVAGNERWVYVIKLIAVPYRSGSTF